MAGMHEIKHVTHRTSDVTSACPLHYLAIRSLPLSCRLRVVYSCPKPLAFCFVPSRVQFCPVPSHLISSCRPASPRPHLVSPGLPCPVMPSPCPVLSRSPRHVLPLSLLINVCLVWSSLHSVTCGSIFGMPVRLCRTFYFFISLYSCELVRVRESRSDLDVYTVCRPVGSSNATYYLFTT